MATNLIWEIVAGVVVPLSSTARTETCLTVRRVRVPMIGQLIPVPEVGSVVWWVTRE